MSKWRDPKWWLGKTEDQRGRRKAARDGLRQIKADFSEATAEMKDDLARGVGDTGSRFKGDMRDNNAQFQQGMSEIRTEFGEATADMKDRLAASREAHAQETPPRQDKGADKSGPKAAGGCLLLIVAVVAGVVIFGGGSDSGEPEVAEPDLGSEVGAEIVCENFVKDRLKSPSSADFSETQSRGEGADYVVVGAVDSENSFGAMIRNDYVCEVSYEGDDQWSLTSLTGLGN